MKHFLLLLFFPFASFAQLPQLIESKEKLSPHPTPRSQYSMSEPAQRSNVILFEDFQSVSAPALPEGWSGGALVERQLDNNEGIGLGIFVDAWQTSDAYSANNGGYFPVPHIVDNLFAFVNDDGDPCNCDMMDVGLLTPEMDFEGTENLMVSFDAYSPGTFGGDNMRLQISTDGTEFTTIYTATSSADWQPVAVDLSAWEGEPSVWLRFAWSDNGMWSTGIGVDNVLVAERFDYNGAILRAHTAEYTADYNDNSVISGEYSAIPVEQAAALTLGARIINKGALPLTNVMLSVTVFFEGQDQGSFNSQVIATLFPMEEMDLYAFTNYTPSQSGEYTIEYTLAADGDEDLSDNIATRTINYSDHVFAMDQDETTTFRNNNGASYMVGNLFEIPNEGSICYSISVGIGAASTVGTEIMVRLYSSDRIFLAGSAPYQIQAADLNLAGQNKIVDIPLNAPYALQGGQDYLAVVAYFADSSTEFVIANSGISQDQFSVLQDEYGDWFFVSTTPMVRMRLNSTVSVDEKQHAGQLLIAPNPVADQYLLHWPEAQPGAAILRLTDIAGKLIAEKDVVFEAGQPLYSPIEVSHLPAGLYQLTVIHKVLQNTITLSKY